jgi:DNA modification methylase
MIIKGDCIKELPKIKNVNLIITDPPYNIGWKYSDKVNDKKKDYHQWCLEWAELCFESLNDNGVLCIINYPENNNILFTKLIEKGYNLVQQLIWNYPTNVGHSKKKYTRSYRTILIFSKGKEYYFNPIIQPYKNPNDKRIKERMAQGHEGTNHYDVFEINLCKNVSKSKKKNGINQLPNELVDILIVTYSKTGDKVLDPFAGNGTVPERAEYYARKGIGIDINDYSQPAQSKAKEGEE